jgi:5-methyltetrahydrofolate--homocysteine methyltransferase
MKPRGWEIVERVKAGERLVFDGGYGTALFAAGLSNGACPELWNDTHAGVVQGIHRGYFEAGSDFVETNTFGGSRLKLNEYVLGDRTRELNDKGARLARSVCPPAGYVAGSIGPTSRLPAEYEPLGDTTDEEYFETFKEQAAALADGGVDIFAVETMMFPQEAVAAVRACKAATDLPVMATMFFQYEEIHDRDRTMWGESPADVARSLLDAGADVVGMNCGRGPDRAITIIREMRGVTDAPLIAYPNAGLPITTGDQTTYELSPEAMAKDYPALLDVGCNIVGGCCGSGPEHIRLIAEVVRSRRKHGGVRGPAWRAEPKAR